MSTIQPEAKQAEPVTANGAESGQGKESGAGKGSPPLTVPNSQESPRRNLTPQGLPNLKVGNPGPWPGSGRPPDRIRIRATAGADELLPDVIESTRLQLRDAKNLKLHIGERQRAHAEGVRGFRGLVEAGPGTKQVTVAGNQEVFEVFDLALTRHGVPPDAALAVMQDVRDHFSPK